MTTAPPSPCIGVCRMDPGSGWCEGCLRTLDEIAAWSALGAAGQLQVRRALAARRVVWRQRGAAAGPTAVVLP